MRRLFPLALTAVAVAAGGALRADDDDGKKAAKRYEQQRRDAAKQFDKQRRDYERAAQEQQKRYNEQVRKDFERQQEWQKRAQRDQIAAALRQRIPAGFAAPAPGFVAAPPPALGGFQQADASLGLRRAVLAYSPTLLRGISGFNPSVNDPRLRPVAVNLAQHAERLVALAQQNADAAAIRQEYAAFAGDWGQYRVAVNRAALDPATRSQAWQLLSAEQQLRSAVGYDPGVNPDIGGAVGTVQAIRQRLAQLPGALQADPNALYDARNAAREAEALEQLLARRAPTAEVQEQYAYFSAAFGRLNGGPAANQFADLAALDRQLVAQLGFSPPVADGVRPLIDAAWELRASADRMRREMWATVGGDDARLVDFYLRPVDDFSARCDLVHRMLSEGTPPEQVRSGWPAILEAGKLMGQRVDMLDRAQFASVHQLASETAKLFGQVETHLGIPPPAPQPPAFVR